MRALVYNGPRDVSVKNMPDATIERATDVLVRITSTNICGSDLHMYEGRTGMQPGRILGHENLGEVIAVGAAVDRVKVGDRVCLPFNIGCGFCANCEQGLSGFCLTTNPGTAGAAYGFAGMGPYSGGQAELLRVPYGDYNCLILPRGSEEKETDYVMLSDIFPTGYHATELAAVRPGESVVIYGAGPVGLMAALSASIKGASQVMVVDTHKDRLALAEKVGAIAIDEVPNLTMNNLVATVKATGRIGVVGVFVPEDPKADDKLEKRGQMAFDFGALLVQGSEHGHRPGQRQSLQPPAEPADRARQGEAVVDRLARTAVGRGARGLRELRPAQKWLDEGGVETGEVTP